VLAAHGVRGVSKPNHALAEHATAIKTRLNWGFVGHGLLHGEPALEEVLRELVASDFDLIVIYPFFMSNGYFVTDLLPHLVTETGAAGRTTILPPLGSEPGLIDIILKTALAAARQANFKPENTRLLLVGRGSRSEPKAYNAIVQNARQVSDMNRFKNAEAAFTDSPPFLLNALVSDKSPTVIAGFFAGDGTHSIHAVPSAMEEADAQAVYAGAVGSSGAVRDLILNAVAGNAVKLN
jgi:sirohydrochlorin ferrochelatase